jgi:hypothetical protein
MPWEEILPGVRVHDGNYAEEELDELYRKIGGCVGFTSTRARTPAEPQKPKEKSDE